MNKSYVVELIDRETGFTKIEDFASFATYMKAWEFLVKYEPDFRACCCTGVIRIK
jgi:hypothetical protein